MKKALFMFAMILGLAISLASCSSSDDDEKGNYVPVTTEYIESTTWECSWQYSYFSFKGDSFMYIVKDKKTGKIKKTKIGKFTLSNGIMTYNYGGSGTTYTLKLLAYKQGGNLNNLFVATPDGNSDEDVPYGEYTKMSNKSLFD